MENQPLGASAPVQTAADVYTPAALTTRLDWRIAGAVAVVSFIVYLFTSSRWVFVGQSSGLVAMLIGATPNTMSDHFIWQRLMSMATRLAGVEHAATAATVACMAISSLALAFTYLLTKASFAFLIEKYAGGNDSEWRNRHVDLAAMLGGGVATVTLAFCAPFWVAASRVNYLSFYLLWMLIAAFLMMNFMNTGRNRYLYSASILLGMGMSQSSMFIEFLPVFLIMAAIGLMVFDKVDLPTILTAAALLLGGAAAMFLVSLYGYAGSPGYVLQEFWGESQLGATMLKSLLSDVMRGLQRTYWLITFGVVGLPWIAWTIVAHRTLNGENGRSLIALNIAILAATLAVVFDSRISPWSLFGQAAELIVLYTMASMTFAYCIVSLYMYTISEVPSMNRANGRLTRTIARHCRVAVVAFAALSAVFFVSANFVHAQTRNTKFVRTYIDRLLEHLDGREWLVSDGVLDDMMLIRSKERGIPLKLLNIAAGGNRIYMKSLKEQIESPRLRNSLDLGIIPFLQEWISTDPDVTSKLAMRLFPDLWSIGDYGVYPRGLAFFGSRDVKPGAASKATSKQNVDEYFAIMDEIAGDLEAVSERSSPAVLMLAEHVRRRVSFVGNNLGFAVEIGGDEIAAMEVYRRVHEFDRENISAMLNYAGTLQRHGTPDQRTVIFAELEDFRARQKKRIEIWELSITQGYVNSPEAFSSLGWTWALTGNSTIALKTLGMALGASQGGNIDGILSSMAEIHSRRGDTEQTGVMLRKILETDPRDLKSIIGLAHISMLEDKPEEAERYLAMAEEYGAPHTRILRERAAIRLGVDDTEGAREHFGEVLEQIPNDVNAHLGMFMAYAKDYAKEQDGAERKKTRERMEAHVEKLMSNPEAQYFQGAMARGHMKMLDKDFAGARADFMLANKTSPGMTPILELILQADFGLKDQVMAKTHAAELLKIAPDHPFANYIMGSVAMSEGNFESAEAYLTKSVEGEESLFATGDLAYVKFKLDDLDQALDLVTRALKKSERLYEVWDTYGQILMDMGNLPEAENALRTALGLNAQNPVVHMHLARVILSQGRMDESRKIMEQIQPFESMFYGDEREYYKKLWLDIYGTEWTGKDKAGK